MSEKTRKTGLIIGLICMVVGLTLTLGLTGLVVGLVIASLLFGNGSAEKKNDMQQKANHQPIGGAQVRAIKK